MNEPLILLPGMMCNARLFASQIKMMHDLICGARLAVISGAGHLPVLEQTELTNKEIKLWLKT